MKMMMMMMAMIVMAAYGQEEIYLVVNVAVADLMGTPVGRPVPVEFHHDEQQLTQLLYMEPVKLLTQKGFGADGDWVFVEAVEQPMFYNGSWKGYRGYMRKDQLCFAEALPKPTHSVIVQYTHLFPRCVLCF